ncbi:hypothetical protein [Streptomyces sp. NPDC001978]|uniref:hypothetical protein n=1 Tax=Streptomyces sp. NPDC001978 TaxID=3364627 RepID=UPI0036CAB43A
METVIKVIVGLKVVGLALFVAVLAISVVYTIAVGPDDPESKHGSTAVCKDGTVLEPPWNVCGKERGYLDHWTTGPAPLATETTSDEPSPYPIPSEVIDGWLRKNIPDACTEAGARDEIPRDRWTPCGQLLGYFDDSTTPPPGAPAIP